MIETQRLILRKFEKQDAPFILQLLNTREWLTNIGNRHVYNLQDAENYMRDVHQKSYDENGYGHYLVTLKNNQTPVGICGLMRRDTLPGPDIGFAFLPAWFGNGYAYESASAVMYLAEQVFKLPVVYAIALPQNLKSIQLLNKIGLRFSKQLVSGEGETLSLFEKRFSL